MAQALEPRSPGRRFLDWIHSYIMSVVPPNLLSASETILLFSGFIVFVVLFISILLPLYLAGLGADGAGYAGSIVPIIYALFTAHYLMSRMIHRMTATSEFSTGSLHFERWSKQAENAWNKLGVALREILNKERVLGETITLEVITSTIGSVVETDEVRDLAPKLRRSIGDRPKTHYEAKLLSLLIPETRDERKQRNRQKIVFIRGLRMWVWKETLVWIALFVLMFLLPLTIFIPVGTLYPASSSGGGSTIGSTGNTSAPTTLPIATFVPTIAPVTATFSPSLTPTNVSVTSAPSANSATTTPTTTTIVPTITPTIAANVSAAITQGPTLTPTIAATTQGPTFSPTNIPTSRAPTFTPTRAPTSRSPTVRNGRLLVTNEKRSLQETSPSTGYSIYQSSYYAIYVFSILFPALYLGLLVLDLCWRPYLKCSRYSCHCRRRASCFGSSSNDDDQQDPSKAAKKSKSRYQDPRVTNIKEAEHDLIRAFEKLEEESRFSWMPKKQQGMTAQQKQTSMIYSTTANVGAAAELSHHHLHLRGAAEITFLALQNFQVDLLNPSAKVVQIRALAIAGRILCLRKELLLAYERLETRKGILTVYDRMALPSSERDEHVTIGELQDQLLLLESQLSSTIGPYTEVAKHHQIQRARILKEVMCRKPSDVLGFELSSQQVLQLLHRLGAHLVGAELDDDPSVNEYLQAKAVENSELQFESILFDTEISIKSGAAWSLEIKEVQFLAWIGLCHVYAPRHFENAQQISEHLRVALNDRAVVKQDRVRRLADMPVVKKCFFWMAFTKLGRELNGLWEDLEIQMESVKDGSSDSNNQTKKEKKNALKSEISGEQFDAIRRRILEEASSLARPPSRLGVSVDPSAASNMAAVVEIKTLFLALGENAEDDGGDVLFLETMDEDSEYAASGMEQSSFLQRDEKGPKALLMAKEIHKVKLALASAHAGELMVAAGTLIRLQQQQTSSSSSSTLSSLLSASGTSTGSNKSKRCFCLPRSASIKQQQANQTQQQNTALKRRNDTISKIQRLFKKMIDDYSSTPSILREDRIRYATGVALLQEQLYKVSTAWEELNVHKRLFVSKAQLPSGSSSARAASTTAMTTTLTNPFEDGIRFRLEVPEDDHDNYVEIIDELLSKSFSGMILMNVWSGKLEEAEGWTDRLRVHLPSKCLDLPCVVLALKEYRTARVRTQLGPTMTWVYMGITKGQGKAVLHWFVFWIFFVLPLVLGLTFVLSHPEIPMNAKSYNFDSDTRFWLEFFGVLLPVIFVLAFTLQWTMRRRTLWFGEKEAFEELKHNINNTLIACQIARDLEQRQRLQQPATIAVSATTIPPRFGGEYPYWAMGEHLITAPGRKTVLRHGHRLIVMRVALVLFLFVICPLVALPPTLSILSFNNQWQGQEAFYYITIIVTILYPLFTVMFFAYKLVNDALPSHVKNGRNYFLAYSVLFFIFPLLLGVPLLIFAYNGSSARETIAKACVYTWVIVSCLGYFLRILFDCLKHWSDIRTWFSKLQWEKEPIEKTSLFTFYVSTLFVYLCPMICFVLVMINLFLRPSSLITSSSQASLCYSIAALEVAAILAAVFACSSGIKLGWIHNKLSASAMLPFLYISIGAVVATDVAVKIVRRNANTSFVAVDTLTMRPLFENAAWGIAVQLLTCGVYTYLCFKDQTTYEMFGYFPDEWELLAPTARFVVEEARDVPFITDDELKQELHSRRMLIPFLKNGHTMDRNKAEQVLEERIKLERQQAEHFVKEIRNRRTRSKRQARHTLAETVFSEIMQQEQIELNENEEGATGTRRKFLVPSAAKSSDVAVSFTVGLDTTLPSQILRQFRVTKRSIQLSAVVTAMKETRKLQLIRFRPTHLLDVLERDIHVVNILFKVIHAYTFESILEVRWITADNVLANFPQFPDPEALVLLVEIRFMVTKSVDKVRLLIFETHEARDEFVQLVWKLTVEKDRENWVYDGDSAVDRLRHVTYESAVV